MSQVTARHTQEKLTGREVIILTRAISVYTKLLHQPTDVTLRSAGAKETVEWEVLTGGNAPSSVELGCLFGKILKNQGEDDVDRITKSG